MRIIHGIVRSLLWRNSTSWFEFFKTDRKVHIGLLSSLYASSLENDMNQLHCITAIPHVGEAIET